MREIASRSHRREVDSLRVGHCLWCRGGCAWYVARGRGLSGAPSLADAPGLFWELPNGVAPAAADCEADGFVRVVWPEQASSDRAVRYGMWAPDFEFDGTQRVWSMQHQVAASC